MSDRFLPTDPERAKIDRIKSWRSRITLIPVFSVGVLGITRLIPESYVWLSVVLAILVLVVMLGFTGYVSFGLRLLRTRSGGPPRLSELRRCAS